VNAGLPAPRPPERADAEIEEEDDDASGDEEHPVIGAVVPTGAHTPQVWSEGGDGQQEECSGDFKPEDAADAAKGTQKAPHAAGDAA